MAPEFASQAVAESLGEDVFVARYLVSGVVSDLEKRAEQIAIGQTAGAYRELSPELREAVRPHLGRVLSVIELPPDESPLDETARGRSRSALLEIAFPVANVGTDLGALVTACFGKVSMDGAIRWLDLRVPASWARTLGGPALGVEGLRARWSLPAGRPPLMAILKPCLGVAPAELAKLFEAAARGGVDIVKDDEVLAGEAQEGDGPLRRLLACRAAAERAERTTGKRCRYAIHLSGPVDELVPRAERLAAEGAECFLVNAFVYGLPLLHALRRRLGGRAALMAHPAFSGAVTGSSTHGVASPLLLGKLPRLAGADLVLFPSPYGTVSLRREVALEVARGHASPIPGVARSFPVPSAGIQAQVVPSIVADFGTDAVVNAGTGIFGHPDGAEAGARAFVKAIDAALSGKSEGKS
jgi:2,3-diketo-5-methylthiopentyl-1-phosphate enolase